MTTHPERNPNSEIYEEAHGPVVRSEEDMARMRRRNRVLGIVLWGFVVLLAAISYVRIKGLQP